MAKALKITSERVDLGTNPLSQKTAIPKTVEPFPQHTEPSSKLPS